MTIPEERLRVLENTPTPAELKELVRWYREAQLLKQQSGSYQRLPGCQCTWEEGDSPCPVHGEHEEDTAGGGVVYRDDGESLHGVGECCVCVFCGAAPAYVLTLAQGKRSGLSLCAKHWIDPNDSGEQEYAEYARRASNILAQAPKEAPPVATKVCPTCNGARIRHLGQGDALDSLECTTCGGSGEVQATGERT